MDINIATQIIDLLPTEFDSHQFIEKFKEKHERRYVDFLHRHINSENGIFRAAHAQIGHFLSQNREALGIEKTEQCCSTNTKGYDSMNQGWKKDKS